MTDIPGDPPKAVNPYKALGISKTATPKDIKSTYKKLALKHHPGKRIHPSLLSLTSIYSCLLYDSTDKVAPSARASAHTKFQEIAFAYAVLSDPARRDRYDTTGSTSESLLDDFNWKSFFKAQYAEVVTTEKLDNLKASYQGSEDERQDVLKAYKSRKGNLTKMFKDIMHSNPLHDEDRFKSIIDQAIAAGDIPSYDAYCKADPQDQEKRLKKAKSEEQEAQDLAKELGVHDSLFGKGRPEGQEQKGLADLIQQRQKARATTFLDDLTAKYVNGSDKKVAAKGQKRSATEQENGNTPDTHRSSKRSRPTKRTVKKLGADSEDEDQVGQSGRSMDEPAEEAFQKSTVSIAWRFQFDRALPQTSLRVRS